MNYQLTTQETQNAQERYHNTMRDLIARQWNLEAARDKASFELKDLAKERGRMGLTPDAVKASAEWRVKREAFQRAHGALRAFNAKYAKAINDYLRAL